MDPSRDFKALLGRLWRFARCLVEAASTFPFVLLDIVAALAIAALVGSFAFALGQLVAFFFGLPRVLPFLWAGAVAAGEFAYLVRRSYLADREAQ